MPRSNTPLIRLLMHHVALHQSSCDRHEPQCSTSSSSASQVNQTTSLFRPAQTAVAAAPDECKDVHMIHPIHR
jgi:hypothetical protein